MTNAVALFQLNEEIEAVGLEIKTTQVKVDKAAEDVVAAVADDKLLEFFKKRWESLVAQLKHLCDDRTALQAQRASLYAAPAGDALTEVLGQINRGVQELGEQLQQLPQRLAGLVCKDVDLSSVSGTTAEQMLTGLGITISQVTLDEICNPATLPALTTEQATFRMEDYRDEAAATLPFLEHLKAACGIPLEQWSVRDIRGQKLSWLHAFKSYKGYLDLGIFPAKALESIRQMRMGFELKHTDEHKQLYLEENPEGAASNATAVSQLAGTSTPAGEGDADAGLEHKAAKRKRTATGVQWKSFVKGQSIMELLCCFRLCEWPLDVVVTDGRVYHVLRLRSGSLLVALDLQPEVALGFVAASLSEIDPSPGFSFKDDVKKLDPAAVEARNIVKSAGSGQRADVATATLMMWQQLAELAPFEKKEDRPGLIAEFLKRQPEREYEVPFEIKHMYA